MMMESLRVVCVCIPEKNVPVDANVGGTSPPPPQAQEVPEKKNASVLHRSSLFLKKKFHDCSFLIFFFVFLSSRHQIGILYIHNRGYIERKKRENKGPGKMGYSKISCCWRLTRAFGTCVGFVNHSSRWGCIPTCFAYQQQRERNKTTQLLTVGTEENKSIFLSIYIQTHTRLVDSP